MTPPKPLLLAAFLVACFFSSCIERSYIHSPVQGNTAAYHSMPLASDSISSATYVNGAVSIGSMNDKWQDEVYSFQAGLHHSHAVNWLRINYGTSFSIGAYNTGIETYNSYYQNRFSLSTGEKFFAAAGIYAGISAASPLAGRGEFRVGTEGGIFNEFGEYYNLRKNLPDSAANEVDKKNYLGFAGLNMEFIFKGRTEPAFGIKIAGGSFFRRLQYYNVPMPNNSFYNHAHDDLLYFSNTYHFTCKRNTSWFQFNVATHAAHFLVGFSHRL